ncbi:MAG: CopG family transcriptional regulator [Chloroflexi bacterium]|nr:MAG: CopG family transcriptional regulator [Chloroflexota bacterium]
MASVKTAISIQEPLFRQVKVLANDLNISRSKLFALAVEEFLQRYKNRQLLDEINRAYDDLSKSEDEEHLSKMRNTHRNITEGEW